MNTKISIVDVRINFGFSEYVNKLLDSLITDEVENIICLKDAQTNEWEVRYLGKHDKILIIHYSDGFTYYFNGFGAVKNIIGRGRLPTSSRRPSVTGDD